MLNRSMFVINHTSHKTYYYLIIPIVINIQQDTIFLKFNVHFKPNIICVLYLQNKRFICLNDWLFTIGMSFLACHL